MGTEAYTKANPRIDSAVFDADGSGTLLAVTLHVSYDLVNAAGERVDSRTKEVDVLSSLSATQKTMLQAFWTKVLAKAKEVVA